VGLDAMPGEQRPSVRSVQVLLDEHLALAIGLAGPFDEFDLTGARIELGRLRDSERSEAL
jgi:hypothetical protein